MLDDIITARHICGKPHPIDPSDQQPLAGLEIHPFSSRKYIDLDTNGGIFQPAKLR